jgi:hypothetical protein
MKRRERAPAWTKRRPRTFEEVVEATASAVRERIERAEIYSDPAVENDFHSDVILHEDLNGNGEWRVDYQDDDGGCYVTIFAGPKADQRARDYFQALKTGALKAVRYGPSEH